MAASPSKINNTIQRRPDDWNARKAAVDSMRPKHSKKRSEPKQLMSLFTVPGMPSRSSADSLSAEASTSAGSSPHRPMLNNNLHVQDALSRIREEDSIGGVWDADFASDITLAQIQSQPFTTKGQSRCTDDQARRRMRREMRIRASIPFDPQRPRLLGFRSRPRRREALLEQPRQAIWTITPIWLSMRMSQVSKLKWQA